MQDTTVQPQEAPVGYDPDIGTVQPAGLTSLDVDVPMRGTVYRFTMPRGEVRVTGYGVSKKFVESLKPLGIVLVAAVLALIVRAIARRGLKPSPHAQSQLSTLCIILGPLGIFFNVFPIVGVIALAGGIVWKFALRRARRIAVAA